ncbi:MAG: VWA domain-containing protein [Lentisphaeria bacterium]|nr:VWA domain-containing protein [Lentisphaeria bacterium]
MSILWPVAFLLILPLAVFHYCRPFRSRWVNALRLLLYCAVVLALAGIVIEWPDRAGTLIAAVDRSRSMPENAKAEAESFIRRLEGARPRDSHLGVIAFGAGAVIDKLPESPGFDGLRSRIGNPDGSNLSEALSLALRQIPADSPGRILLLTDGLWTGSDPARAMALAAARGVPVDVRPLKRSAVHDLAIADIEAPLTAAAGEFYTLNCRIVSPVPQRAVCRIRRGSGPWMTREVELHRGVNFVSWRDRSEKPGIADYTVEIAGTDSPADERPENNRARRLIEIAGRKQVLLLTESPSGNLGRVLREAGIPVVSRRPSPAELTPEKLAGYSGVIIENVPASRLGPDGMSLLAGMVKSGALGLMMTGGRSSFAVGGYFRSPLEEVLPVSMEQRQEMRKSLLALTVALDRSGSMAAPVGNMTKMDMANLATLEVFKLLMPRDEFSVIAVDSAPHVVIPLTPVEDIVGGETRIRSIESMGGGIFTYTALHAATAELMKSKAVTRHLILFADAADAEEPGAYRELLARTAREGITVSVVGLGFETDSDAEFLKDVAKRGNGMIYFSDRADELPRIFAQDTFLMARNTFIDTPVEGLYTAALRTLSKADFGRSAEFGGYNLCYGKEGSEVILVSNDEFKAPLAATGQAGLGRVSVLTAEADGEYTGQFAADPMAGTLLSALAGWMTTPDAGSEEYLVTQTLADGVHRIEMHLNPDRERDPFKTLPVVNTVVTRDYGPPAARQDVFTWVAPDRLEVNIPLEGGAVYLSTVGWEGKRPEALAPAALIYSPEFRPEENGSGAEVMEMAESTGGRERLLPDGIWKELPPRRRSFDLTPWIALAALILLLLEVSERRLGIFTAFFRRRAASSVAVAGQGKAERKRRGRRKPVEEAVPAEESAPESPAEPEEEGALGDALRRARRR